MLQPLPLSFFRLGFLTLSAIASQSSKARAKPLWGSILWANALGAAEPQPRIDFSARAV